MSLVISLDVLVNFLSGPHSNRHKVYPSVSWCDDFSEVHIKSFSCSLQGLGKRTVFVLRDSKSEGWKKIGNISLESCSQVLEETRRI